MIDFKNAEPVVIVGMHRSGTTILSKYLDEVGIFMGRFKDRDENNESRFFIKINNWILRQFHSEWDNVDRYIEKNENWMINTQIEEDMKHYLNSWQLLKFTGKHRVDFNNPKVFWGWKDPRTSVTLDIWLKIFPNMKIIFTLRNPIDIAASLKKREEKVLGKNKGVKNKIKRRLLRGNNLYQKSPSVLNIDYGVNLWNKYNQAFLQNVKEVDSDRIFYFTYEDFLLNPTEELEKLNSFLGVKDEINTSYLSSLDATRRFAFLKKPELVELYNRVKDEEFIKYWGYSNIME